MPWGLKRFQQSGQLHFLTFSCYRRRANFASAQCRAVFEVSLEKVRQQYGFCVYGYVVMPEHVHLLVSEPERGELARALQSLKQSVARTLALRAVDPFWQARYYDFNVWSEHKFLEKLRYIHRNPVRRGLVARPQDWKWSSFRHYVCGEPGKVEIESQWTARRRERMGIFPRVQTSPKENPRPSTAWTGHPRVE
jgi:putative transposase